MTTLENEFNKLQESKRANVANEGIKSREADIHQELAGYQGRLTPAQIRANEAKASRDFAGIGSDAMKSLGSLFKGIGSLI